MCVIRVLRLVGWLILFSVALTVHADEIDQIVPQTWQLLDYLANDYRGAVKDGQVVSESEYAEMREFAQAARMRIASLPAAPGSAELRGQADELIRNIADKVDPDLVNAHARALADALLAAYPVPTTPTAAPDIAKGAALYASTCVACHGAAGRGDGPAGVSLTPMPANFTDVERADGRSVLSLYEAISHGVSGTAMASFSELSDADRWALAFYVSGFAYPAEARSGGSIWKDDASVRQRLPDLSAVVRARPSDFGQAADAQPARAALAYLRAHPDAFDQMPQGLTLARTRLSDSLDAYRAGHPEDAARLALSAYLDGIEPVEPALSARDPALRIRLETAMGAYRAAIAAKAPVATLASRAADANAVLDQSEQSLGSGPATSTATFLGAFTILVREGLEALLVVVAMLAFLRKTDRRDVERYVHAGWLIALGLGGVTWWIATYLVSVSGAGREVTEGLSSLFAAVVLLGVGIWMHQKSIGGRWQAYLHTKLSAALNRRSALFLFGLSFIAVYREVFETILFYAALWSDGQGMAMLVGLAVGMVTLAVIAWVLLRTSRRLPIGTFFAASSWLIALLAFVLTGKGIAALQEAGWVSMSPASVPRMEWLGVFPSWQSLGAQACVAVIVIVAFLLNRRGAPAVAARSAV